MKQIVLLSFLICSFLCASAADIPISRGSLNLVTSVEPQDVQITIFPNPTTEFIQLSDYKPVAQVVIFNLVGRKMKTFDVRGQGKFNIGDLPNGLYLVQLVSHEKKIITTQRISKK